MEGISVLLTSAPSGANTPLHKIIKALDTGLGYQFHAAWGLVLQVFAVLFEVGWRYLTVLVMGSEINHVHVQPNLDILNFIGIWKDWDNQGFQLLWYHLKIYKIKKCLRLQNDFDHVDITIYFLSAGCWKRVSFAFQKGKLLCKRDFIN